MHGGPQRTLLAAALAAVTCALAAPAALADHPLQTEAGPVPSADASSDSHGDPLKQFKDGRAAPSGPDSPVSVRGALPSSCPVVSRTTDDRVNSPFENSQPVVKVIYAHPVDVGNRIGTYSQVIQSGARALNDFVNSESGGLLSLRFDIGNFEGPHCLDIQRVALPNTAAYYSTPAGSAFSKLLNDVALRLGPQPGVRNYLIYADLVAPAGIAGEALAFIGPAADDPGGAIHALGHLPAVLYGRGGTDFFGSSTSFDAGQTSRQHLEVALHEVSHTLGAVQQSAPNSSGTTAGGAPAGHCADEWDLMCYSDGGSVPPFVDSNCDGAATLPPDPYGPDFEAWDCNKDDYFNTAPAGGSYLDTHWNLADSTFVCAFDTCTPPDAQRPDVTIERKPRKKTKAKKVKFTFEATERAAFTCEWDGREPVPCASPLRRKAKKLGKHMLVVRATDRAGLTDLTPAKVKFKRVKKP
jgi:hypothetical protein